MPSIIIAAEQFKTYKILEYSIDSRGSYIYKTYILPEQSIIQLIVTGKLQLLNADVVNGELKGTTGDLSRFKTINGVRPIVIIVELILDGAIIGYRVADHTGKVRAIKVNQLLEYCSKVCKRRTKSEYIIPIQNAIYTPETDTQKAYLKMFGDSKIPRERLKQNKPNNIKQANVDIAKNEENVSKLEQIFSKEQLIELKKGKDNNIDIRIYANNKLSALQMKELRLGLENKVNVLPFASPEFNEDSIKAYVINSKYGVDVSKFINPEYNREQIYELSTGVLSGIDISKYADPKLTADDMSKERLYLESLLWNEINAD